MATKTKYQIRKAGKHASYFTGKIAITPLVAVVDTGTALLKGTTDIVKTAASAVTQIVKAPFTGAVRGNQIHKAKYGSGYAEDIKRYTKLVNGDLIETVVESDNQAQQ